MKIAVFSDIHDNLLRWSEAEKFLKTGKITIGICCGDVTSLETLKVISNSFNDLYLCFGNADYKLENTNNLLPENVILFEKEGRFSLGGQKIGMVHYDYVAEKMAETGKFDFVFYGHTHTPWQKIVGKTVLLNPGEIAGQFGLPSLAIVDLKSKKTDLKIFS